MAFKVIWDNGHASGALGGEFDTYEDAEQAGKDWHAEMVAIDPNPEEAAQAYSFEVVEARLDNRPKIR